MLDIKKDNIPYYNLSKERVLKVLTRKRFSPEYRLNIISAMSAINLSSSVHFHLINFTIFMAYVIKQQKRGKIDGDFMR